MARVRLLVLLILAAVLWPWTADAQSVVLVSRRPATDTLSSNGDSITIQNTLGFATARIQTLDSYSGTWEVQCSVNGVTFDADDELNLVLDGQTSVAQSVTDTVGIWSVNIAGCAAIKIIATAGFAASDTSVVVGLVQSGGGSAGGGGAGSADSTAAKQDEQTALLTTIDTSLSTLAANPSIDATYNQASRTTGPQVMCYGSVATPTDVGTDGFAQRPWCDTAGRLHSTTEAIEDAAETAGAFLSRMGAVRRDAAASSTATDGENATVNTDALGLLWTRNLDPCSGVAKLYLPFDITTATTTEITPSLSGSNAYYYICAINIITQAANSVNLVDDNTDGCGSVTASLISSGLAATDGWYFAANGGLTIGNGNGSIMRAQTANSVLCLVTSAATELHGQFVVAAAP